MDPQHRLLLEVAWEALEHAAEPADRLHGSNTGVFVGISTNEYVQMQLRQTAAADLNAHSLARRLAEASPADAIAVLNKAINASFANGQAVRRVCLADIEAAIETSITVSGTGPRTHSERN